MLRRMSLVTKCDTRILGKLSAVTLMLQCPKGSDARMRGTHQLYENSRAE